MWRVYATISRPDDIFPAADMTRNMVVRVREGGEMWCVYMPDSVRQISSLDRLLHPEVVTKRIVGRVREGKKTRQQRLCLGAVYWRCKIIW